MQNDCFPGAVCEWPKASVGSLADVNPRYRVKKGRDYPFIEMAAVGEDFQGIMSMDRRVLEGSGLSRFRVGDTLFAKITPCPENGKVAFVSHLPDDVGLGSTEFIVLSPRRGTDPRFLYHLACSHAVRGRAAARMEGSTGRQRVPEEVFTKRLLVPIPGSSEQTAIARILDAVDTALERTRAAVERAREAKRALVQRVLTEGLRGEPQRKSAIGLVPRSWLVVPISSVVGNLQYGLSVPMEQKGTLPILRMGNIQNGEAVLADLKYVSLPEKVVSPYLLKRGDVLFNRTNSQEWVGKVCIYRHDTPAVFASYLIRLFPDGTKVDNYYLGHVLGSYSAQCRVKRYATPGVQQVNINATNLGKVLIPLPIGEDGLTEQREISALLEAADAVVRSHEPVLATEQSLKASLMHDLLTGRVRVTNEIKAAAS
jgi:type I restriction enzyme S subunit